MATRRKERDPIPDSFASLAEAAEFWDSHSTADYEDLSREVHCDVDLRRRTFLVPIDGEIARAITTLAQREGLGLETLVNVWLKEKLTDVSHTLNLTPDTCQLDTLHLIHFDGERFLGTYPDVQGQGS